MGKSVIGFGCKIDRYLLMGKHNDVKMGNPENFLPEDRFPALTVLSAGPGKTPVVCLKDSLVETSDVAFIDIADFTALNFYEDESVRQFDEWKVWVGLNHVNPHLFILQVETAPSPVSFFPRHGW